MYKNIYEETYKSDVDVSSLKPKTELNPKLWHKDELDIKVRRKLLIIAKNFMKGFDDIKDFGINDVVMTGSLANYNWDEKNSDIDLHIIIDFSEINDDVELVKQFFDAVRKTWDSKHKGIKIYGYPIEIYVQDINEPHVASGIYSLIKGEWIKKPSEKMSDTDIAEDDIQEKTAEYMNAIDDIEERCNLVINGIGGEKEAEDVLDSANDLFKEIKDMRKEDLSSTESELSTGNLIFKSLRRNGYIGRLIDIKTDIYDFINSL